MKNKFLLSLFFLCILTNNSYPITLIPAVTKLDVSPNETKLHSIEFINDSSITCEVNVKASEIDFDSKGNRVYNSSTGKKNIIKNMSISPTKFIVKPGEQKTVSLNIKVPDNIKGSDDAMIFFSASPIYKDKNGKVSKMMMETGLGSLVILNNKGSEIIKSKIKKADVNILKNKTMDMKLEVLNQGNTHLQGSANIAVFTKDERFIGSFSLPKSIIFPGQSTLLQANSKFRLQKGEYNALITYQYDDDRNVVIDRPFEVK